jgi:hypothetical protein
MTWSSERKAKQSQAIRQWQPWLKSTGAKTAEGKAVVSRNAYKGGHRPYMRQLAQELTEECQYTERLVELARQNTAPMMCFNKRDTYGRC